MELYVHHILLVDDDLNFRRSLLIHMELEGYKVTEVENPRQALSILDKNKGKDVFPDVVITDIKMPEMDGRNFASEIKRKHPGMPIIMISAFDVPGNTLGFPFLRKPFKVQEILDIVKQLEK